MNPPTLVSIQKLIDQSLNEVHNITADIGRYGDFEKNVKELNTNIDDVGKKYGFLQNPQGEINVEFSNVMAGIPVGIMKEHILGELMPYSGMYDALTEEKKKEIKFRDSAIEDIKKIVAKLFDKYASGYYIVKIPIDVKSMSRDIGENYTKIFEAQKNTLDHLQMISKKHSAISSIMSSILQVGGIVKTKARSRNIIYYLDFWSPIILTGISMICVGLNIFQNF